MSIRDDLKNSIVLALKNLGIDAPSINLEHPADLKMGDYSTNIAMALAKSLKMNPKELAEKIAGEINKNLPTNIEKVEALGGFINFHFNKYFFQDSVKNILEDEIVGDSGTFSGKTIMVEYTDPNPFKPFHIGHLMTNAIGESIARILEHSGAKVYRANYQGDVGLHVARAIYALIKYPEFVKKDAHHSEAASSIGQAYAKGSEVYEADPEAKKEIDEINKKIYARSDERINELYDWGFKVTMNAFEDIYDTLGTQFDYYFLESKMAGFGQKLVEEHKGKIFSDSDGAVVFKAEEHDPKLHTRVFITSAGLPTYETKELGLTDAKFEQVSNLDFSIVVTANEQLEYMRVVMKALSLIHPEVEKKMKHLTHGMMRFSSGKMSSRKGNVITGESLMRDVRAMVLEKIQEREMEAEEKEKISSIVGVAAIKYGILRQSTGGDIIFDFEKALSFEGDSGPYLQYSYARAKSVLEKAAKENLTPKFENLPENVTELEKLLYRFPKVALRSAEECEPHYIANFLIELARSFNSFYGNTQIIDKDDSTTAYKLALVGAFSKVMQKGLHLLGIQAPEKM